MVDGVKLCDAGLRQTRCISNIDNAEQDMTGLLDENGYKGKYKNKIELQKDPNYDIKEGIPDIVSLMNIDCFWITTKMRYKFWYGDMWRIDSCWR